MTEQSKEYIITDCLIQKWLELDYSVRDIATEIRSGMHPVSTPPEGVAPDYEHCGNMSSDGEHDCNYRGGHCNFAHTRHCKDFIPCTCEYCDGTVHDAAIRQAAREEVLDGISQWAQKHTHLCRPLGMHVVSKIPLSKFIQSLRQSKQKKEVPE
jgi:hypothetical protein